MGVRLSLRLVVGGLCATVVLIVAVVTLAITYSVSIATVRDIGKKHSVALATTARVLTEAYFDLPTKHLDTVAHTYSFNNTDMPSNLPESEQLSIAQHEKTFFLLFGFFESSNFTYGSIGTVFDDGSGSAMYLHEDTWVRFVSRFVWKWPASDMIVYVRDIYVSNMTDYRGGEPVIANVWGQQEAYPSLRSAAVRDRRGFWPGVSATQIGGTVKYTMPCCKPIFNETNQFIGMVHASRPIAAISRFLAAVKGTPHTEAFAVDGEQRIVGSTHAASFSSVKQVVPGTPVQPGCSSSAGFTFANNTREYHGCRRLAREFHEYPPLQYAAGRDAFLRTNGTEAAHALVDDDRYFIVSTAVPNSYRLWSLNVILCMPESDVLGDIVKGRNTAIVVTVCVFVVASLLSFGLVYALLQPLSAVSERMRNTARLEDNAEEDPSKYSRLTEIRDLQMAYSSMNTAVRSFTRYVPREVVKDLLASEQLCTIGMVPQVCTMLFVDIVGFTGTCERVSAEPLSGLVSQYFDVASRIVMSHDGLIDKFIGDCIMAVWGAPFAVANQEVKAALTGKLLDRACLVPPLSRAWWDVSEELRVRVGISTGEVLAGNMGSEERMNYTVIGDPVNLAARLESMNKQFGTHVMVSEATAAGLGGAFVLRLLMPVAVVGKSKPVNVYEVVGAHASLDAGMRMALDANEHGALYPDAADDDSVELGDEFTSLAQVGSHAAELGRPGDGRAARMRRSQRSTVAMLQEAVAATAADHPLACTAEEAAFAAGFTEAVRAYVRADFAGALQLLDEASAIAGVCPSSTSVPAPPAATAAPSVALGHAFPTAAVKSVNILLRQIERYRAVDGLPADFDGVYHTEATDLRS